MKLLIELPTWLGDAVMSTPAIENILSHYPNASVSLVGSKTSLAIFREHPLISKTYTHNKKYLSLLNFSRELGEYDIFFTFRSSFRSMIFKIMISSRKKFRFSSSLNTNLHQVERYNKFVNNSLCINNPASNLVIYSKKTYSSDIKKTLGINPGASYGDAKRWNPLEFAKVAIELSSIYDIKIFGSKDESNIAEEIVKILTKNNIVNFKNLAGQTDIPTLISHISELDLFITGDSGPMHIASSFQIPTIAIFGPTEHRFTSQWMNPKSEVVKTNLDCQPCMKRECPLKHNNCMNFIKAKKVIDAVHKIT